MAHGMGGTFHDYDEWVEILSKRRPTWHLRVLQELTQGTRALGDGIDRLADTAAAEMIEVVRSVCREDEPFTLHCIGHSMGGLILRGALPRVVEVFDTSITLGNYLSLSSPHLGTQATTSQIGHYWRNASFLTAPLSSQLVQLSMQDGGKHKLPYLVELSDADGPYMGCMRRFRRRTCAAVDHGDLLVPVTSGVIHPQTVIASAQSSGNWNFRLLPLEASAKKSREREKESLVKMATTRSQRSLQVGQNLIAQNLENLQNLSPQLWKLAPPVMRRSSSASSADRRKLRWMTSRDGSCTFPVEVLDGLNSVHWQRLVVEVRHPPLAANLHVFLIGKAREQFAAEHAASKQCIEFLVGVVFD
jgi:hypothetical protein